MLFRSQFLRFLVGRVPGGKPGLPGKKIKDCIARFAWRWNSDIGFQGLTQNHCKDASTTSETLTGNRKNMDWSGDHGLKHELFRPTQGQQVWP